VFGSPPSCSVESWALQAGPLRTHLVRAHAARVQAWSSTPSSTFARRTSAAHVTGVAPSLSSAFVPTESVLVLDSIGCRGLFEPIRLYELPSEQGLLASRDARAWHAAPLISSRIARPTGSFKVRSRSSCSSHTSISWSSSSAMSIGGKFRPVLRQNFGRGAGIEPGVPAASLDHRDPSSGDARRAVTSDSPTVIFSRSHHKPSGHRTLFARAPVSDRGDELRLGAEP
jgi:hypothetical protein